MLSEPKHGCLERIAEVWLDNMRRCRVHSNLFRCSRRSRESILLKDRQVALGDLRDFGVHHYWRSSGIKDRFKWRALRHRGYPSFCSFSVHRSRIRPFHLNCSTTCQSRKALKSLTALECSMTIIVESSMIICKLT